MGKTSFVNLTGKKFGRLTVLRRAANYASGGRRWLCVCECGTECTVGGQSLSEGRAKSCGCLRHDIKSAFIHGKSKTNEFAIWLGIKARCSNPNVKAYPLYGGAGVTICERWLSGENGKSGFECFLDDMGPRPKGHSVDRFPNTNGNYEPSNCRWATMLQQANNKRNTRWVIYHNQRMPLREAVRVAGDVIHYEAAAVRIRDCGWTVEDAVETPRLHESPNSKSRKVAYNPR